MNLKDFRHKKGITQKEMALRMAMEQTTYSRKENGKSPITEDEWKRFAKVLDTSIEELKKGNESVPKTRIVLLMIMLLVFKLSLCQKRLGK